jgi:uncharacterized protein
MHSAIYHGWLRHRRFAPRPHAFRYPLFLVYLDLAELDQVFQGRWLWSTRRRAPARFDRADHLGDPDVSLDQAVRDLVQQQTGRRPRGPIRLLTHLRYFGHCFNPVSFYYCFDAAGVNVECMVAEVNNTPWGEQHCYVLSKPQRQVAGKYQRYASDKAFHVSPFMPMELAYDWGFSTPGEKLNVHIALHGIAAASCKVFDATLQLEHAPITGAQLAKMHLRFPLMTLQVVAAIHWQALKLWIKCVPVYTHPAKSNPSLLAGKNSSVAKPL